jgi:DNA-binding MarR family transcriptional regulator
MTTNVDKAQLARAILELAPLLHRTIHLSARVDNQPIPPPHLLLLKLLRERSMSQSEMAQAQRVVPSTMSATVDVLVRRGWVQRESAPHDRRVMRVEITPEGENILLTLDQQLIGGIMQRLDGLSDDDLRALEQGLALLRRMFLPDAPDAPPFMLPPFPPPPWAPPPPDDPPPPPDFV